MKRYDCSLEMDCNSPIMDEDVNGEYIKYQDFKDETAKLLEENKRLKDLVIWMTGCGYDFCQHEYFINQREKLLKDVEGIAEQALNRLKK